MPREDDMAMLCRRRHIGDMKRWFDCCWKMGPDVRMRSSCKFYNYFYLWNIKRDERTLQPIPAKSEYYTRTHIPSSLSRIRCQPPTTSVPNPRSGPTFCRS